MIKAKRRMQSSSPKAPFKLTKEFAAKFGKEWSAARSHLALDRAIGLKRS
jgi:hypothetical protein